MNSTTLEPQVSAEAVAQNIAAARAQRLGDIPQRSAERTPDKIAMIDGDVVLTFAQLEDRVQRTCAAIDAAGIGKGDAIALFSHNCWQYPVMILAAARRGVVTVPVNFMLGPAEIAYILNDSGACAFVVEDQLIPAAEEALEVVDASIPHRIMLPSLKRGDEPTPHGWTHSGEWTQHEHRELSPVDIDDDDPIRIMYTSGTESRPKGALLSSRSLMWQYTSCISSGEMDSRDVELHTMPLYHCAQLDNFLMTDLYLGATSIILRRPEPGAILDAIETRGITKFFSPPTVWISLITHSSFAERDLSTLQKGYYGASAMPIEVLKTLGERLPHLRLWNFYGQTEMASLATVLPPEEQRSHGGSAGYPALNVQTRIVDDEGNALPRGEVGEIVLRSPHLTLGYLGNPEKTAEAFSGGWFHSGDLGYFDEGGRLYVVDRKKDMIKTGGENVSSREVEEVLYQHPSVAEVSVFGIPHPRWVEAVAAAVVLRTGMSATEAQLIEHARGLLAGYKSPKKIVFVEFLPKNPSGKILKRELRVRYEHLANDDEQ